MGVNKREVKQLTAPSMDMSGRQVFLKSQATRVVSYSCEPPFRQFSVVANGDATLGGFTPWANLTNGT